VNANDLRMPERGGTVAAFDHLTLATRDYHNAGNTTTIRIPLAVLAALFDRLGRYEPAATVAGFAFSRLTTSAFPAAHLIPGAGERSWVAAARAF
jgi:hypothetical protein